MSTPMTYNSLVAQIESYLDRSDADTIAQIPYFIYQAENRICRESKSLLLESYLVSNFITGTSVYAKPATWRRTLSWNWGSGDGENTRNQLLLRSYEFIRNYWPDSTQTGDPLYYCDYGYQNWLVAPTPAADSPFEVAVLQLPDPITPINQTNYLTNYCPDLFLYACLLEAVPYLKNDERIPVWQSMYERGLASLNNQDDQRKTDRASDRSSD